MRSISAMDRLELRPDGKARLQMTGMMSETGQLSLDDPNSNSVVKMRGESEQVGKLGTTNCLSSAPSWAWVTKSICASIRRWQARWN